ncbi:Thioredoxin domain-containing protein EC-YbbN [Leucobacter sp. 7(1)]|uniref:tetratricopeptide repeat protein n=1 Tax=Leucobacter sp. 7(1) TaxID=1255613 RepID=UPI00097EC987|nr:tetratricopeptide repeat protein [Leucobacter sp. 7(1)]SJN12121.1 Thioredoxin domain-containing protein EC-YbbN [Leucobacter sp. 7(1)]
MAQQMPERIPGGGVDLSHLAAKAQAPAQPGGGPTPSAGEAGANRVVDVPSLVMDVTDASFEQAAQLSTVVPVVVDLHAEWSEPSKELSPVLARVTREFGGRVLLARVDADANPGLVQAFQAQAIPTVVALVAGRPVPLFQGAQPEAQIREVFGQLLQLAEQHGVTGQVAAPDAAPEDMPEAPAEPEIPAAHVAAVEAAERGDFDTAVSEWEAVLAKAPADAAARAALVQMRLLQRLAGRGAEEIRAAAAAAPSGIPEQLAVADLDLSGGHIEDAFLRVLDLFAGSDDEARPAIRERLLELFEVVGVADPRVIAARGRLANLLY